MLLISGCASCWRRMDRRIGCGRGAGIQHEQQHQELIVTDLKYLLGCNPLGPIYREAIVRRPTGPLKPSGWKAFPGGIVTVGHEDAGFSFDNERPRHQQFLSPFELQDRLVSAGEYLEFMDDGGYDRPELWLSLGWSTSAQHEWTAPLYWSKHNGAWREFTLGGYRPVNMSSPVTHVSYFEADAYARWRGARLPTETEWEHAASQEPAAGELCRKSEFSPRRTGRERRWSATTLWRSVAVDAERVFAVPWICSPERSARGNIMASSCAINMCSAADRA